MDDHGEGPGPVTSVAMRPSPRVRCGGCSFEWFGPTASHGLRIVGACPHCGGTLDFLVDAAADAAAIAGVDTAIDGVAPSSVLGTPTSWDR